MNESIAYICGKCYKEVPKEATVCPSCGTRLGKIKCPFCYFTGTLDDFSNDTCPKCGKKNKKSDIRKNIKNNISLKKKINIINKDSYSISNKYFWSFFCIFLIIILIMIIYFLINFNII